MVPAATSWPNGARRRSPVPQVCLLQAFPMRAAARYHSAIFGYLAACRLLLVGYHSKAGTEANPLAHTLTLRVAKLSINGTVASETLIHSWAAALHGVPVVFLHGGPGAGASP